MATIQKRQTGRVSEIELLKETRPHGAWQKWGAAAITSLLVLVAYYPSVDNGFVSWDDDHYLYDNHQVHYNDGIFSIWGDRINHKDPKFERGPSDRGRVSHQYYPMVFTLYWLEFRFHVWFTGADPNKTIRQNIDAGKMSAAGFHVVSVLMHIINVFLLMRCIRALGLSNWVAWAAVIIFAVHPMQVASVAWAAERKNIVSLMFYLLSLLYYIKLRREGRWWQYALSLVFFQSALFSKTVSLTLPAMLFFTDRLLERRWDIPRLMASVTRILPFMVLSACAAYSTIQVEDRQRTIPISDNERPVVAGAVAWFYPTKMLCPTDLSPVYPLWDPDMRSFAWYLPMLGVIACGALVIIFRKKLGPHFLWALLFYLITMFPMMGFKNINYFQFAFVADHYFYHGAVGLCILLALVLERLGRRIGSGDVGKKAVSALVVLGALGCTAYTYGYCDTWQDADSFWERTIAKNPKCWPAYYNTANARSREANTEKDPAKKAELYDKAAKYYDETIKIHPVITQPYQQLVRVYRVQKKWPEMLEAAQRALRRWPNNSEFNSAAQYASQMQGMSDKTIEYQEQVLRSARTKNEKAKALAELGQLHLEQGDMDKSVACYEKLSEVAPKSKYKASLAVQIGNDLFRNRKYAESLPYYEDAYELRPNNDQLKRQIERIRSQLGR